MGSGSQYKCLRSQRAFETLLVRLRNGKERTGLAKGIVLVTMVLEPVVTVRQLECPVVRSLDKTPGIKSSRLDVYLTNFYGFELFARPAQGAEVRIRNHMGRVRLTWKDGFGICGWQHELAEVQTHHGNSTVFGRFDHFPDN